MTHTTDTPRTDAVMASSNWPYHITSEMQKIEREFRIACKRAEKAESEVERLKEQLESTKLLALKFWHVLEENGFKIELPNDSINTQNSINPDNK